jgi:hypothetical protein
VVALHAANASDNFNRDDSSSCGTDWDAIVGVLDTNGSAIQVDAGSGSNAFNACGYKESTVNFTDDQCAELTVTANDGVGKYASVAVHITGTGATADWYAYMADSTDGLLQEITDGVGANLDTGLGGVTAGDEIAIEWVSGTLKAYLNGVEVGSASDSTITSGQPGMAIYPVGSPGAIRLDDFVAYDGAAVSGHCQAGGGGSTVRSLGLLGVGQ